MQKQFILSIITAFAAYCGKGMDDKDGKEKI